MLGGTFGYNYQTGSIVWGVEGDIDWARVNGSTLCIAGVIGCETSLRWLATARGRIGYAFDRWLPYVTAGIAAGDVKASFIPLGPSAAKMLWGYTFGAGLEYAFLGNWSAKIEYLYVDLGKFDTGFTAPIVDNVSFKSSIVRLGVNYRFSGPMYSRW